jgi:hypothetical protein
LEPKWRLHAFAHFCEAKVTAKASAWFCVAEPIAGTEPLLRSKSDGNFAHKIFDFVSESSS